MAAANSKRIQDIRQFNQAPENELNVLYGNLQPGEVGPVGRKRYYTSVVILDLVQDFQDLARRYDALEARIESLEQGTNPSQPPMPVEEHEASPSSGAFLKG
jgi:hypothetical protein